jgi:hypothetical protein
MITAVFLSGAFFFVGQVLFLPFGEIFFLAQSLSLFSVLSLTNAPPIPPGGGPLESCNKNTSSGATAAAYCIFFPLSWIFLPLSPSPVRLTDT